MPTKKRPAAAAGHRYCIYARVSPKGSSWAAQETSIGVQLQECRQYILDRVDPLAQFTEVADEFRSGKDLNRPGMQQILGDIESGRPSFDTLVVWQLDRLSRNLADAAPLFERLRDAGLGFVSIRQSYLSATGAMARFNLTQTIAIAQLEREMTSERISAKMHWIAQNGKVPWGIVPFGYRRRTDVKNTVEVVPEEAEVVRKIFAAYLSGVDRGDLSTLRRLQEEHRDRISDVKHVYRLLRNRFYVGEISYNGEVFRGEHEPIIERDVFDAVQSRLPGKKYHPARPGRRKYPYLLSGLVRCCCDPARHMRPASVKKKDKRYFYYKCTDSGCGCAINAEKLDAAVLEALRRVATDPEYIRECYDVCQRRIAEARRKQQPRITAALEERDTAEAELKHIDGMFMSGVISPANMDYWNEKLVAARERVEKAKREYADLVAALEPLEDQLKVSAVIKSLSAWATALDDAADDVALKRNLIEAMVFRVRCVKHGEFEIDLALDTISGKNKIGITSDVEVMPNGGEWWFSRHLNITLIVAIAVNKHYRKKEPRNGESLGTVAV